MTVYHPGALKIFLKPVPLDNFFFEILVVRRGKEVRKMVESKQRVSVCQIPLPAHPRATFFPKNDPGLWPE